MGSDATLYAVVVFDGPHRDVEHVITTFESIKAGELYAMERGVSDYAVAPIAFHPGPSDGYAGRRPWTRERQAPALDEGRAPTSADVGF